MVIERMKNLAAQSALKSPFFWHLAWKCLNTFAFSLPHDDSYWALKHFCLTKDNMFLDIGANTGISALSFRKVSNHINQTIPILSVEPNTIHERYLARLINKIPPFSYLLTGVGMERVEVTLHTPIYKGITLHTFTSVSKQQVNDAVSKSFGKRVADKILIKENTVKIVTVDDLECEPSIIKIDAEGFDYQVILGSRKTLQKTRPFYMFEACWSSFGDISTFFNNNDYALFNYCHKEDQFSPVEKDKLYGSSEGNNIFAIPIEKMHQIPVQHN
ncbi:MAG: FkbM family methyltransferase [Legionellaceae bacterium]|nr:FkbM family methyltransferase [Legionellaceae bacterium]